MMYYLDPSLQAALPVADMSPSRVVEGSSSARPCCRMPWALLARHLASHTIRLTSGTKLTLPICSHAYKLVSCRGCSLPRACKLTAYDLDAGICSRSVAVDVHTRHRILGLAFHVICMSSACNSQSLQNCREPRPEAYV